MIALIQRVTNASVTIENQCTARIGTGLLALIGVEQHDADLEVTKLVDKLLKYRVFSDDQDRMNLDLEQISGELLLVPQFTLAADTSSGRRPGFSTAACPAEANRLFSLMRTETTARFQRVQFGTFGADMQVALTNDGPVTFWLQV